MSSFDFSSVVQDIAAHLLQRGRTAAVAESLTGGLVASEIVRVAGSSRWFIEGVVTYTDAAKIRRLGVDPAVIAMHTAVSRETAEAMAMGCRFTSGADITVATTGLAGPGGDEFGRPAGLVYIAGACEAGVVSGELHLSGDRTDVRETAAYAALMLLRELSHLA